MDRAGPTTDTRQRMDLSDHIKSGHVLLCAHRENAFPRTLAFAHHACKKFIYEILIFNTSIIYDYMLYVKYIFIYTTGRKFGIIRI